MWSSLPLAAPIPVFCESSLFEIDWLLAQKLLLLVPIAYKNTGTTAGHELQLSSNLLEPFHKQGQSLSDPSVSLLLLFNKGEELNQHLLN